MLAVLFLHRMSAKRRIASIKRAISFGNTEKNTSESIYCRTCLSTENLVSIFFNADGEEKMSHNLKIVTGLEIKMNDGLSQKICTKCLKILTNTLEFRRKSKHAEKALLGMVGGNITKPTKKMTESRKYSIDVKPPKLKKAKVEQDDYEYTVHEEVDVSFGDDFQNDEDFDCKEDVKPIYMVKEQIPPSLPSSTGPRKTMKIPNAASYRCNTCSKEFRMKATYKAHMRFHTNYCVCEACGKRCRNNNQLQEHKRARHGLGRIHKCAYCEYSSATKEALTIHERRHTGERPYICDHCGATFHRRSNLVQHIAIHLPEKNFQCSFCPTREKSKKRLQIHISKNHRPRRYSYKCPRCYKLFIRNEHTHRHLARVHHIPRTEHPPIERVLVENTDKDCSYKPLPYPCEPVMYHSSEQGIGFTATTL